MSAGKETNALGKASDQVNRSIAIANTVWLALDAAETDDDVVRARDTLYEVIIKLVEAERLLGVYQS